MRIPLSLLLALSLLVQSFPYTALAEEAPVEPDVIVVAPIEPAAPAEEPIPVVVPPVEEPAPAVVEPAPAPIQEPVEVPVEPVVEPMQIQALSAEPMLFADTPTYLDISGTITLPNGCEMADDTGTVHLFPVATTTEYLAVCALAEALDEDVVTEVTVSNSSFGLFVSSVNGVAAGTNEYWSIWINDGYANCGVSCQTLAAGDEIAFVRTAYDPVTYAETQMDRIELTISSLEDAYDNVIVPDACTATDVSGTAHSYPAGDDLLGICALVAARAEGYISGFELTDATFGLFVSSLNGIPAGTNEYWAIWMNGGYANCGVSCQTLAAGDEIAFVRTAYDPVTYAETQHERIALRVIGSAHVDTDTGEETGGTGGGDTEEGEGFDVSAAFFYLADMQESDGMIQDELVTDWAAIAFAVSGSPAQAKSLLKEYLRGEETDMENTSDYIRHSMAMLALNLNPYSAGPEDYVTPIVESFDGTQIGEDEYINDDIFSLIVLPKVGYDEDDELIKDIVSSVLSQQGSDGKWLDADMTAAAIQALAPLSSMTDVSPAVEKAKSYLRSSQRSDGSFGNAFTTVWAIQAIYALRETPESWTVNDTSPLDYLASKQREDGSIDSDSDAFTDAWVTTNAIPAVRGKTWDDLLDSVRKQEPAGDTKSDEKDEDKKAEGEVLGAEDALVAEPLAPAFTFDAPAEVESPSSRPSNSSIAKAPEASPAEVAPQTDTVEPQTLTAAAPDAEGSSWLMRTIGAFWEGLLTFFRNLFS